MTEHLLTVSATVIGKQGRQGEAVLIDGLCAGESWPYLWIGVKDGPCHALVEWRELEQLADAVAARRALEARRLKRRASARRTR